MEENENLEEQEVNNGNNEVQEEEEVTTGTIDYSQDITEIKTDIKVVNHNLSFIVMILILWCILSNFVYKKGWTR